MKLNEVGDQLANCVVEGRGHSLHQIASMNRDLFDEKGKCSKCETGPLTAVAKQNLEEVDAALLTSTRAKTMAEQADTEMAEYLDTIFSKIGELEIQYVLISKDLLNSSEQKEFDNYIRISEEVRRASIGVYHKRRETDPDPAEIRELETEIANLRNEAQKAQDRYLKLYFQRKVVEEFNRERVDIKAQSIFEGQPEKNKVLIKVDTVGWFNPPAKEKIFRSIPRISYDIKVITGTGPDYKKTFIWWPNRDRRPDPSAVKGEIPDSAQ